MDLHRVNCHANLKRKAVSQDGQPKTKKRRLMSGEDESMEWILTCDMDSKYMEDNSQLAELQNQFQTMSLMGDGEEHMEWSDLDCMNKMFSSQMDDLEKRFKKMSLLSLLGDIEEHMEWTHISNNMDSNRSDCNENLKRKAVSQSGTNKKRRKVMSSLE